ncbi:putative Tat-binding-like protein 7 [Hypsibius exemplaris]|uniref:Tat-binding-like protein 7 n=1 Tax=Hypsibius exemplaris TaxID=2072580 RepID=A0A1W0WVR5_HYPEX|nr:putative Tat-binding-like protein 7 [Hypsibius exemplaris]
MSTSGSTGSGKRRPARSCALRTRGSKEEIPLAETLFEKAGTLRSRSATGSMSDSYSVRKGKKEKRDVLYLPSRDGAADEEEENCGGASSDSGFDALIDIDDVKKEMKLEMDFEVNPRATRGKKAAPSRVVKKRITTHCSSPEHSMASSTGEPAELSHGKSTRFRKPVDRLVELMHVSSTSKARAARTDDEDTHEPTISVPDTEEDDDEEDACVRRSTRSKKKVCVFEETPRSQTPRRPASRNSSEEIQSPRKSESVMPASPKKVVVTISPRRTRSKRFRHTEDEQGDEDSLYDRGRRYPKRNRLPVGSLAMPTLYSDNSSSVDDAEEEAYKKKAKRPIPRGNTGGGGGSGQDLSGKFEPTIYFPAKEISFATVGGYLPIKEELRRSVIIPFRQRIRTIDANKRNGTDKPVQEMSKGALFWGPPGTGKTLMAKALAWECGKDFERPLPVYIISGAELLTKWVGESETHLREIFNHASENSPSIIFMDELDGLVRKRTTSDNDSVNFNMVSTLLTLLNGVMDRGNVLAIATTNFKEVLDPALLRSGRFDLKIHFPSPVESERALILQAITQNWHHKLDAAGAYTLARNTAGFTGADLDLLCKKAKNIACQRQIEPVSESEDQSFNLDAVEVLLCDYFVAWQEVEPSGHTTTAAPYEPLSPLLKHLLQRQLDSLWAKVTSSFSVRVNATGSTSASLLNTAAWAAFSQPGLLLDFNPVVFIHSQDDPMMLDLLCRALFHNLAERNTVRTVDLSAGQRLDLSHDRSHIFGLLRLDAACVPTNKPDRWDVADIIYEFLQRRDKLRCPLLVISSTKPIAAYCKEFKKRLGVHCKFIELTAADHEDCSAFFRDMFLNEALRTARDDGQMVEINMSGTRDLYKTQLQELSETMAGLPVDTILSHHQRLSVALNQDRAQTTKHRFLKEIEAIKAERLFDDSSDSEEESD